MRYLATLLTAVTIFSNCGACLGKDTTLQDAWAYYLKRDYNRAIDACRIVSKDKMLGEEGHYIMGLSFLKLGQAEEARENFDFILKNYPNTKIKDKVMLGICDSYYVQEDFKKAEAEYAQLLRASPGTDYASIIYLQLGDCQRRSGKWKEAESSFRKVINDFPLSLEAKTAKYNLSKGMDFFSVQVGAFSKEDNAQNLAYSLRQRGYDAYVEKLYKKDSIIYRVRVGRFNTKEKAEAEAAKLKKEGFKVRICV